MVKTDYRNTTEMQQCSSDNGQYGAGYRPEIALGRTTDGETMTNIGSASRSTSAVFYAQLSDPVVVVVVVVACAQSAAIVSIAELDVLFVDLGRASETSFGRSVVSVTAEIQTATDQQLLRAIKSPASRTEHRIYKRRRSVRHKKASALAIVSSLFHFRCFQALLWVKKYAVQNIGPYICEACLTEQPERS